MMKKFDAVNQNVRALSGPLLPVLFFIVASLFCLGVFRFGLMVWQWQRVIAVHGILPVLLYGVRMDLVLLSPVSFLPAIFSLTFPKGGIGRVWSKIQVFWFTLWFAILVFMEAATPSFIGEYDARPNRLFVEYLGHPKEVFGTLFAEYKFAILVSLLLIFVTAWGGWKINTVLREKAYSWSWKRRVIVMPFVLIILFLGARSTLGPRPVNPSTAAFSPDHLINDLGLNSTYSLVYAVYRMRDEANSTEVYGEMEPPEIYARIRKGMGVPSSAFTSSDIPTLHRQNTPHPKNRPYNLVIILEESLGARYVGSLGGKPLTPELDKLTGEGLFFARLYATGTRSVRGIEAVVAGFTPTPARSVVKLGLAQQNFFTLGQLLRNHGYKTEFIYGGQSHFDNMRGFFLNNGFERVIDENDYIDPVFHGTWGVSDEDIFNRADEEFRAHGNDPFFALIFSVSNHSPFEYPDNRITSLGQEKNTRDNAIRYADYALGEFFKKARHSVYWQNTVFLIVADHDSRVYGDSLVPIDHFHIPALILGPDIKPERYNKVASQIDLAPTLLSLMGLNSEHPMIGRDLLQIPESYLGRAIMQYGNNQAYMIGDKVVIQQPGKEPSEFLYSEGKLLSAGNDPELARDALAQALWSSITYRQMRYCLAFKGGKVPQPYLADSNR